MSVLPCFLFAGPFPTASTVEIPSSGGPENGYLGVCTVKGSELFPSFSDVVFFFFFFFLGGGVCDI